ncbi:hypothetical protein GFH30_05805 [Acinetobacter wanghuae]|uniref:DUF3592 domain-containing protein n=1 Tax=Acinetobacter wanghuae TaxID=2662362 RepID=A0A5Q0P4C4_9GAMM|nr:hypothetical protein [Acinetobacter wanghuae]MQW91576.1 hypothetical protein [Acinetobacter wanghuae]QGA10931.1 hypothetical protein GFH30_05805 [Acinetobacter wanghuae]
MFVFPLLIYFNLSLWNAAQPLWMIIISITGSGLIALLCFAFLIETCNSKIVIHTDSLTQHCWFKTKTIYYRDIQGYRLDQTLSIYGQGGQVISIPPLFSHHSEMCQMMKVNFKNLAENNRSAYDEAFFAQVGELSASEKQQYIDKANRLNQWIGTVWFVLFILSFFQVSEYFELAFYLGVFFYFYLSYSERSLLRIHFVPTALPNALHAIWILMTVSGLLMLYEVIDHQDFARYLIFSIACSVVLFILLFITANLFDQNAGIGHVFGILFVIFILMFIYSMSFVSFLNRMGKQEVLYTQTYTVIDKDYSSGIRGAPLRYSFVLKSSSGTVLYNIGVLSSHYDSKQIGDEYQIKTYKGNLGIAWTQTNGYSEGD